jgi:hypothetical protein
LQSCADFALEGQNRFVPSVDNHDDAHVQQLVASVVHIT